MKNIIGFFVLVLILISCTSDNDMKYKDTDKEEVKSQNPVGIQNVNGGIPDTINTIDIGTHQPDTTLKPISDSTK